MDFFYLLLQLISAILIAPLFDGISRKLRAKFQSRIGPSIFQTYLDLFKLLKRGRTKSHSTSYIYQISPYVLFVCSAAMFCALFITLTVLNPCLTFLACATVPAAAPITPATPAITKFSLLLCFHHYQHSSKFYNIHPIHSFLNLLFEHQ